MNSTVISIFFYVMTLMFIVGVTSNSEGYIDDYEPSVPENYSCTGNNFMWYCQYCQCQDGVVGGCTRDICPKGIWRQDGSLIHRWNLLEMIMTKYFGIDNSDQTNDLIEYDASTEIEYAE